MPRVLLVLLVAELLIVLPVDIPIWTGRFGIIKLNADDFAVVADHLPKLVHRVNLLVVFGVNGAYLVVLAILLHLLPHPLLEVVLVDAAGINFVEPRHFCEQIRLAFIRCTRQLMREQAVPSHKVEDVIDTVNVSWGYEATRRDAQDVAKMKLLRSHLFLLKDKVRLILDV